jgi:protein associated with RNAse G/E
VVRAVDLDLDVIRLQDGHVFVDDEDEFDEHRLAYGYPPDVVALAELTRDRVHAMILGEVAPYDGTHRRWLAALRALIG